MSVFTLLLNLALLGLVTWAMTTLISMPQQIRTLIISVAVIVGVLYVLNAFGIGLPNLSIPKIK